MKHMLGIVTGIAVSVSVANADYVGNVVGIEGLSQVDTLIVTPGESFTGAVVLEGDLGTQSDFALFRVLFSKPGLEYSPGWYEWSSPYTTGGVDDFSTPGPNASGVIESSSYLDPFAPDDIDVAFENVTDSFGEFFGTGTLLTFELTVPVFFEPGELSIQFVPDTFTDGAFPVVASIGSALTVIVVPAPGTALVLAAGGLLGTRRRRRE